MELLLDRDVRSRKSTMGQLFIDGVFECFTLEDVDRKLTDAMSIAEIDKIKVFGQTAIPTGRYEVIMNVSNRFKRVMPLLLNVKGFEGVRMHRGNTDIDTHGCPLVGTTRGIDIVYNSRIAEIQLYQKLNAAFNKKEKIFITIKD